MSTRKAKVPKGEPAHSDAAESKKVKHETAEIDRLTGPFGSLGRVLSHHKHPFSVFLVLMIVLPIVAQFFWYSCVHDRCEVLTSAHGLSSLSPADIARRLFPVPNAFSITATAGWLAFQWILAAVIPGWYYLAPAMTDGRRIHYKVNGITCWAITVITFFAAIYFGYLDRALMDKLWENTPRVVLCFSLHGFIVAVVLYLKGLIFGPHQYAARHVIVDFFYGYDINPRFFDLVWTDVKWVMEGRALIQWQVVALLLAYRQYLLQGSVSLSMGVTVLMHTWYIVHYFVVETNVLSMLDFTADNMGWMLGWGNSIVPQLFYTLPEAYILGHPENQLPLPAAVVVFGAYLFGYVIFEQANTQKHQFRSDPSKPIWGKPPRVLRTKSGRELLLSGWWGVSRKMNYFGDLLQTICYALPAMAPSPAVFINFLFLCPLLIHRERRDNAFCKQKYGSDWDEYCKLVPYRIVPYIY